MLLLLFGLIFRGIAFEFRGAKQTLLPLWDAGFFVGSIVVAFVQGAAIGAMMRGIQVVNGQYAGHTLRLGAPVPDLHRYRLGAGLCVARRVLARFKERRGLRNWAYARIPWLAVAVLVVLGLAFTVAETVDAGAIGQSNLQARSWGFIFPIVGVCALLGVIAAARARRDRLPFALTVMFFGAAYLTLGVMSWPYMIPYSVTVANAAAPDASLAFFLFGGVVALPVVVAYTIGVYWVFRGKTQRGYGGIADAIASVRFDSSA